MMARQTAELTEVSLGGASAVTEVLDFWVQHHGDHPAVTWLADDQEPHVLHFKALRAQSLQIAGELRRHCQPGDRAILLFPPGPDFIAAFLGCLYAGVVAVPATEPKPRRLNDRLSVVAADCRPAAVLCTTKVAERIEISVVCPLLAEVPWIDVTPSLDATADAFPKGNFGFAPTADTLAFLQYTSGSTSEPKGVAISHRNLLHNLEMIRLGFRQQFNLDSDRTLRGVFWLPPYHDMGLIGGILTPLYLGGTTVLMSPVSFLKRPRRWLETISKYQACISGAPNFAYDLCVDSADDQAGPELDLACWDIAFCGAEPIHAATLERFSQKFRPAGFRNDSFYPCYGLAENTLLVSGQLERQSPTVKQIQRQALEDHRVVSVDARQQADSIDVVGCGQALLDGEIVIVDPKTHRLCPIDVVGEIWYRGASVASQGYWERPQQNQEVFEAKLVPDGEDSYLRTGDMGFLCDGELFVTGRLKEMLVIRGRNFYPQDLERTVQAAHPGLADGGAALVVEGKRGETLVIVQELARAARQVETKQVFAKIRAALAEVHELRPASIVLVRPYSLPRTTSGKMQRLLCRQMYLDDQLKVVDCWTPPIQAESNGEPVDTSHSIADSETLASESRNSETNRRPRSLQQKPLDQATLTGFKRRRLAEELEEWLRGRIAVAAGVPLEDVAPERPLAELGFDSMTAVKLVAEIEARQSVSLNPIVLWNYPTARELAKYLAEQAAGRGPQDLADTADLPRSKTFNHFLEAVEAMADDEVPSPSKETSSQAIDGNGAPNDPGPVS